MFLSFACLRVALCFSFVLTGRLSLARFPADQNLPPTVDLETLANNSLFLRWRPSYHVLAPGGHMNDPCGPMYDDKTKNYHIFYQSFPQHVNFGNTTWGHAISKDLITWTDVTGWRNREYTALAPGPYPEYDWLGVFSGSAYPVGLDGKSNGNLTIFFAGDQGYPDNWQKPYRPGTEKQNLATSSDGGITWQKYSANPVIPGAPAGWNVTGLRDPIFGPLPELDKILEIDEPTFYMQMGSGIRGVGPRIPLYKASANDLTDWTFQGSLVELPQNESWGGNVNITGSFGSNFELANLYNLPATEEHGGDGETQYWFITMGAEGYESFGHPLAHWSLFAMGNVSRRANGSAEFHIQAAGPLDWGNLYALNSFNDPVKSRRIVWGWSDEDFFNATGLTAVGYQGTLGLPREEYVMTTHGVAAPSNGAPDKSTAIWSKDDKGTYTVTTVGQRPALDVVEGVQKRGHSIRKQKVRGIKRLPSADSAYIHIHTEVTSWPEQGYFGLLLRLSPHMEEYTELYYHPSNGSVVLNRLKSSLIDSFTKSSFVGHFEPYTYPTEHDYSRTGKTKAEPITIDVFVDNSLIEIFINDRFAMTSKVYPSRADSTGVAFVSRGGETTFDKTTVWTKLVNVWPERPTNSSSPLLFDPYYETHVLFPNPYVDEGTQIYSGN